MNLRAYANGVTQAVNPNVPLGVRISAGYAVAADGKPAPGYQTPSAFTAAISGNVLSASKVGGGYLASGQSIRDLAGTTFARIVLQISGAPGGAGTYLIDKAQTFDEGTAFTSDLTLQGNVQPLTWKDLQHPDALNQQGTLAKIYLYGAINAILRPNKKGGDLIIAPSGRTYLVTSVFEQWASIDFAPGTVPIRPAAGSGSLLNGSPLNTPPLNTPPFVTVDGITYGLQIPSGWCAVLVTLQNG